MQVNTVALKRLGSIDALDLQMISRFLGRDFLPFPFLPTRHDRFAYLDEYTTHAESIPDRFNHGDLSVFKKWFTTYTDADIRVECQVLYFPASKPSLGLLAHRCGQHGFLAAQQPGDVIEMYTLSPYDLGAAIAGMVELTNPGTHPQIVIPEYVPQSLRGSDGDGAGNRRGPARSETVPSAEVTAYATVQSHRQPARTWGVDQDKDTVVWVGIRDDGDYIYVPGYRYAKPVARRELSQRIDRLIADDVAVLRESRNR